VRDPQRLYDEVYTSGEAIATRLSHDRIEVERLALKGMCYMLDRDRPLIVAPTAPKVVSVRQC
jgi:hypothetical protein